jgi:hypothetical protein
MSPGETVMIECPVCHEPNHHLAVTCKSCGSFVQRRIDNLDLFTTAWKVIEKPAEAFHEIAIARHKNFALVISGFAGMTLSFGLLWALRAGDISESILPLIAAGLAAGPVLGNICMFFLAALIMSLATLTGIRADYRNTFAVVGYSMIPLLICAVITVPFELLSFGSFFYSSNPTPYMLKPASAMMLFGIKGLCFAWSAVLVLIGSHKLFGSSWGKTFIVVGIALVLFAGIVAGTVVWLAGRGLMQ